MPNALILDHNTAIGAYLARLLQARGTAVHTTSRSAALTALGIATDVTIIDPAGAPQAASSLTDATIFALTDPDETHTALITETVAKAAQSPTRPRLCHVIDHAALRHPALKAQARQIITLRQAGHHAVNAILHAHDSRLGDPHSISARIITAACNAAQGNAFPPLEIPETGPRDWGWTPEYVDAIQRLAALPHPQDLAIGTGHLLTTADFVAHAFAYFKADPTPHIRLHDSPATPEPPIDTARFKAATGWSATTWGRDLVHTLCEGAAAR